jgi:hypothetical protein
MESASIWLSEGSLGSADSFTPKSFSRAITPTPLEFSEEMQAIDSPWGKREPTSKRSNLKLRLDLALFVADRLDRLEAGQTGGVYKVPEASQKDLLAVFKPEGQECFERRGIPSGEGAVREEAAYVLDRLVGSVAGVPVTTRIDVPTHALEEDDGTVASTPQPDCRLCSGAVQRFVQAVVGTSEDFGVPRQLKAASEVVGVLIAQQVAAFDIRLCNTDRHGGNLLFQQNMQRDAHASHCEGTYVPVPIDHGCALPRWWAMGEANFEAWSSWPQVKVPCLPEVLSTIEEAFHSRDAALTLLAELGLEPAAQATYYIAVSLLREGVVRHGLSLGVVAELMGRDLCNPSEPSWLEVQMADCATDIGLDLRWEKDSRGDTCLAPPENPGAWPPESLLKQLEARFCDSSCLGAIGKAL